jgi:hypothetical protein
VQRVDGSMDPLEGRIVLHGHISEAGVVSEGPLDRDLIRSSVNEALQEAREFVDPSVKGPLVFRLEIAPTGELAGSRVLLDRLASSEGGDLELLREEIADRIAAMRFPAAASATVANVPLIF